MTRQLSTVEKTGTTIVNISTRTEATIIGSYVGGFVVERTEDGSKAMLPFENIDAWEVPFQCDKRVDGRCLCRTVVEVGEYCPEIMDEGEDVDRRRGF